MQAGHRADHHQASDEGEKNEFLAWAVVLMAGKLIHRR